jgi:hypothetical protein
MGHAGGGAVHDVFQTPGLFGLTEVTLDWETQSIVVHKWHVGQLHITAEQDDMGLGLGAAVRFANDDHMQRLRARLMEQWRLVAAGLNVPLHGGRLQVWQRDVVIIDLAAILAMGTPSSLGAGVGEVQGRLAPQLGNEGHVALPGHRQGVVVANVPIESQIPHSAPPSWFLRISDLIKPHVRLSKEAEQVLMFLGEIELRIPVEGCH